jgi:hypothetical protein
MEESGRSFLAVRMSPALESARNCPITERGTSEDSQEMDKWPRMKKRKEKPHKMMTLLWMESKSCNDPGLEGISLSDKRASFAMNKLDFPSVGSSV